MQPFTEYPRLLAIALTTCPSYLDAHDIVMELLLESNGTMISNIMVRHAIIDEIRRYHSKVRLNQRILNQQLSESNSKLLSAESICDRILSNTELSPFQKEVLYLKYYQSKSMGDIAEITRTALTIVVREHWTAIERLKSTGRRLLTGDQDGTD